MSEYNVAIVGATGAVGTRMIQMVEQSTLKVKTIKLLASKHSAGTVLKFKGQDTVVEETTPRIIYGNRPSALFCWWRRIEAVCPRSH